MPHPGYLAVPTLRIDLREAQIASAMEAAEVPPDVACLLAMRRIHNRILRHNIETHWLLDAPPAGSSPS